MLARNLDCTVARPIILAALFAFIILFAATDARAVNLMNESIKQVGGRVFITYDMPGTGKPVPVSITIKADGKRFTKDDLHLEGDIGRVEPGNGKKIVWNLLMDFPRGLNGNIEVELNIPRNGFIEMGFVQGGCFDMGCGKWNTNCENDELPKHNVCVSDYFIGLHEVTQKQWVDVMGSNPSFYSDCEDCPVEQVTWPDVQKFIKKLNRKNGKKYRLPTEAEWEFAARGRGGKSRWAGTDRNGDVTDYAWLTSNANGSPQPVGSKAPNKLGLYDMTGNVWEFCSDWYDSNYYSTSPSRNPTGVRKSAYKVARGGSWFTGSIGSRTTFRSQTSLGIMNMDLGFRLAMTP